MFSVFIPVIACIGVSFLFMIEKNSVLCVYHILLIRSPVGGIWVLSIF